MMKYVQRSLTIVWKYRPGQQEMEGVPEGNVISAKENFHL